MRVKPHPLLASLFFQSEQLKRVEQLCPCHPLTHHGTAEVMRTRLAGGEDLP